jgi:hypothetical protein
LYARLKMYTFHYDYNRGICTKSFFLGVFYPLSLRDSQNDMLRDTVLNLGPGSILHWDAIRMYVMPSIIHGGKIYVHKIKKDCRKFDKLTYLLTTDFMGRRPRTTVLNTSAA